MLSVIYGMTQHLYFSVAHLGKVFTGIHHLNNKMCVNTVLITYSIC